MAAVTYNIAMEQGATYEQDFIWTDTNDQPYNLTGYAARMQIRPTIDSNQVLDSYTTANGRITVSSNGTIKLLVPATVTAGYTNWPTLAAGQSAVAVYDLELESGGVVTRLLKGKITLDFEVTR